MNKNLPVAFKTEEATYYITNQIGPLKLLTMVPNEKKRRYNYLAPLLLACITNETRAVDITQKLFKQYDCEGWVNFMTVSKILHQMVAVGLLEGNKRGKYWYFRKA